MNRKFEGIVISGLLAVLVLGFSFNSVSAESTQQDRGESYRELLNVSDGIIRSLRFGEENAAIDKLDTVENMYLSTFSPEERSSELGMEVESFLDTLKGSSHLTVENARTLRGKIEELAENSEGVGLSFIYEHAIWVIFSVSIGLSFLVNMISRTLVDWEKVNSVKREQSELKDELDKAKKERDLKKMRKLQTKYQQFTQEHMGVMFSPMKTMLIIFIPFMIAFSIMRSVYGGWVVAWLPFNLPWPHIDFFLFSRFFRGTVASLSFFGWYLLTYFGLSQIFRKFLIPSR